MFKLHAMYGNTSLGLAHVADCFAADGSLSSDVFPQGFSQFSSAHPSLRINSPAFCKALFEMYLAANSVVQDVRKKWTAEAIALVN